MKQYNVCVVGIGAVGTEMVRLLKLRKFPMKSLTILARSERVEVIDGEEVQVKVAAPDAFNGMDFAFFAGTEGAGTCVAAGVASGAAAGTGAAAST